MARSQRLDVRWARPSVWVVVAGGALTIFFLIAIVREVIRTTTVRRQVERLRQELALESQRQGELEDLIGYLSSPTFQEREARLRLGLKKTGERVIVIPPAEGSTNSTAGAGAADTSPTVRRPMTQWWNYFFGRTST